MALTLAWILTGKRLKKEVERDVSIAVVASDEDMVE